MKWRITKESPEGSGTFEDTGEVFDDGIASWDDWSGDLIQGRLADLQADPGGIYQASWVPDPS